MTHSDINTPASNHGVSADLVAGDELVALAEPRGEFVQGRVGG